VPALYVFCAFYAVCLLVTYACYLRGPLARDRI
jgi:MFS transporter, NNP family, nitrate/nitrite transporter